jgi:hypothetical protein
MAGFIPISAADVDVGRPTKKEIFERTRCNFDDHETRIANIESGIAKVVIFDDYVLNGVQYSSSSFIEDVDMVISPVTFTLTTAVLTVLQSGTSGTFEIDILKGPDSDRANATTIFDTRPSVDFSAGDHSKSVNAVFSSPSGTDVTQNDHLFLDITSFQPGGKRFHVLLYGELS